MSFFDPQKHHRRSIRLKGYDYSREGWYFITICTKNRQKLFGDVVGGEMVLNAGGKIVKKCWTDISVHFPIVVLDKYVIMPNHLHGIIYMRDHDNTVGAKNISPLQQNNNFQSPSRTIGSIIRGFKIGVTKWFRKNTKIYNVWQRNYYEHIIRDEPELNRIRNYIIKNPANWQNDKFCDI